MLRISALLALLSAPVSAFATSVRGTVVVAPDQKPVFQRATHWRVENGLLPILPQSPDPRSEVVVVLDGAPAAPGEPPTTTMELRGLRLDPPLVIGPLGFTVQFKNSDRVAHRLYIESKTASSLMAPEPTAPGQSRAQRFFAIGEYTIRDKEFPHVVGYVVVVEGSSAARADERGQFKFDVPAGHYTLRAFFRGAWVMTRTVEVAASPVEVEVKIPAGAPRVKSE
jgi:hypothetical protein